MAKGPDLEIDAVVSIRLRARDFFRSCWPCCACLREEETCSPGQYDHASLAFAYGRTGHSFPPALETRTVFSSEEEQTSRPSKTHATTYNFLFSLKKTIVFRLKLPRSTHTSMLPDSDKDQSYGYSAASSIPGEGMGFLFDVREGRCWMSPAPRIRLDHDPFTQ